MTLSAFRDTRQISGPIAVSAMVALSFPVAAATTIYAGDIVCTDSNGRAVPLSASTALKAWGRAEKTVVNTVAAGFGSAGQLSIDVMPGVFSLTNGSGADAIAAADVGKIAYGSADATANLTDGAGLRPALGKIYGLDGTQVKVGIGEPTLYDMPDDEQGGTHTVKTTRARNVVVGAIADLTAYTVASNAAVNDAVLNVAGDVVLLVNQTTASENGLYVVGTVSGGFAPLTRLAPMPVGATILADEHTVIVAEGTVFAHTKWFNTAGVVIGTTDPAFFPERVTITQALVNGTFTLTSVPLFSATKSGISITREVANTSTATTGGYVTNGAPTAGKLGTVSIAIMAAVAAGTINANDVSTLNVTITNR